MKISQRAGTATRVRERKNNNGVVHFEVDYWVEGRRKREYCKTRAKAKVRADQIAILKRNQAKPTGGAPPWRNSVGNFSERRKRTPTGDVIWATPGLASCGSRQSSGTGG